MPPLQLLLSVMLVCHCNVITDRDIERIIRGFLREDPWGLIVPAKVYRELGKRGRCCGCFPNVVDIITKVTDAYHRELARAPQPAPEPRAVDIAPRAKTTGERIEGRTPGHRAA